MKIRIAQIKGKGIYKRCRKQDSLFIEGIGENDNEALKNLKIAIDKKKNQMREFHLHESAIVYDAEKIIRDDYSVIQRPLMPEWSQQEHNVNYVNLETLINL